MKKRICPDCKKGTGYGKYCIDCGKELIDVITPDVKFKKISTNRSAPRLKTDIRNWLSRIGVQQTDIQIEASTVEGKVNYILKGKKYEFISNLQDSERNNLAAVEQFLHYRVLGIERGIESKSQAFAGYEALPDFSKQNSHEILGIDKTSSKEEIKKRYKELAKIYHPDVNSGNAAMFERYKIAYEELIGN